MSDTFTHGYALLIGIGESAYPNWSLPVTVKDVQALQSILTDLDLCAYPNDDSHMHLLHDTSATRWAILDSLAWLKAQAAFDPEATIIVYYSGHGWLDRSTGQYYLLPYDVEPFDIPGSALSAQAFTDAQYEDQRRLADDPKAKRRAEREIADLRAQLAEYEAGYQELGCQDER